MIKVDVGDSPTFSRTVTGTPNRVEVVHFIPGQSPVAYPCELEDEALELYSVTLPTFGATFQGQTHGLQWNAYLLEGDTTPRSGEYVEFQVSANPLTTPFLSP